MEYFWSSFALKARLVRFCGLALVMFAFQGLSFFPATAALAGEISPKVLLSHFPVYAQSYYLSCEYAASRMITAYWGKEIREWEFINDIPSNPNPHIGFRGYINGDFGGTWDYGIYPEPIARVLEKRGFKTKLIRTLDDLKQELTAGRPVQVWTIVGMGWSSPFTAHNNGLPFTLAAGEHSVVIYGYDSGGVYVADPGFGTRDYYLWNSFLTSWNFLDNMAMSVWLPSPNQEPESNPGISPYFYRYLLNEAFLNPLGRPLSGERSEGNKIVQYFERARLEFDPQGPVNQSISLGLLGKELTAGRENERGFQPTPSSNLIDSLFFPDTAHNVQGSFLLYWKKQGGLAFFGYPISEIILENNILVQYFERARLELSFNPRGESQIQMGRLGAERLTKILEFKEDS